MKPFLLLICSVLCLNAIAQPKQKITQNSPDGTIQVTIHQNSRLYYSVTKNGTDVLLPSPVSMQLSDGRLLTQSTDFVRSEKRSVNEPISTIWGKRKNIPNSYNELRLEYKPDYSVVFRIYNNGVAYRIETRIKETITIEHEEVGYRFRNYPWGYFPLVGINNFTSWEMAYTHTKLFDLGQDKKSYLPLIVEVSDKLKVAITESDVIDYPGLYLKKTNDFENNLESVFAPYPLETRWGGFNGFAREVVKSAPYIAQTKGTRSFPWRILVVADNDKTLADCDLVYQLATPNKLTDTDWIKPGMVVWDWWNDYNITGVDFEAGINTRSFMHYIDFASKNGFPYVIFDWRWTDITDLSNVNPDVDMEALSTYAKQKNTGIILWCPAHRLISNLDATLDQFASWGVKGIKVDFFERNDQLANRMYTQIAEATAKRKMVVDYHGCYIPTGLSRTYPNILNWEAVRGMEVSKWSEDISPEHDLTLAFTRLLAGPMDYTPGAMKNAARGLFRAIEPDPMSQGTRCHQLAMYVIFDAGLQMLSDCPRAYENDPQTLHFLKQVPVNWDETLVLEAKVADYLLIARKKGNDWLIGGFTDWDAREFELDFSFLDKGVYKVECWTDGINAHKRGTDYKFETFTVDSNTKRPIKMAPGGGIAMKLTKQ